MRPTCSMRFGVDVGASRKIGSMPFAFSRGPKVSASSGGRSTTSTPSTPASAARAANASAPIRS
ncbi:MAG TPA: hypothetical protein PKC20_18705, partial [Burkholderiaceae bacterium]|nr:hypothetical protein [Burkholderiaceae bacterium]